jgi:hypothetical protein
VGDSRRWLPAAKPATAAARMNTRGNPCAQSSGPRPTWCHKRTLGCNTPGSCRPVPRRSSCRRPPGPSGSSGRRRTCCPAGSSPARRTRGRRCSRSPASTTPTTGSTRCRSAAPRRTLPRVRRAGRVLAEVAKLLPSDSHRAYKEVRAAAAAAAEQPVQSSRAPSMRPVSTTRRRTVHAGVVVAQPPRGGVGAVHHQKLAGRGGRPRRGARHGHRRALPSGRRPASRAGASRGGRRARALLEKSAWRGVCAAPLQPPVPGPVGREAAPPHLAAS